MEQENRELRQPNDIPAQVPQLICLGGARPPSEAMIAWVDEHRGIAGSSVEPIRPEVMRAFAQNSSVYAVRKVWRQMRRGRRRGQLDARKNPRAFGAVVIH